VISQIWEAKLINFIPRKILKRYLREGFYVIASYATLSFILHAPNCLDLTEKKQQPPC